MDNSRETAAKLLVATSSTSSNSSSRWAATQQFIVRKNSFANLLWPTTVTGAITATSRTSSACSPASIYMDSASARSISASSNMTVWMIKRSEGLWWRTKNFCWKRFKRRVRPTSTTTSSSISTVRSASRKKPLYPRMWWCRQSFSTRRYSPFLS